MSSNSSTKILKTAALGIFVLLLSIGLSFAQSVDLTAAASTATLPDGNSVPMWGYTCTASTAPASCDKLNPSAAGWSPLVIRVSGASLTVKLTNSLPASVPETSLTIVGQLGGGLGTGANAVNSPLHAQQTTTWPSVDPTTTNNPPLQPKRVQSFATPVTPGNTATLTWNNLRPGTYLIESGTHPSIQGSMGLYGMLIVTASNGDAYPGVTLGADVPMLFSEIDPVQNTAVDLAVKTAGFTESAVWDGHTGKCGDPAVHNCYPPTVNYTPLYYLINGVAFDKTHASSSLFKTTPDGLSTPVSGSVLVRMVNAGLRMHVPSIVGAQTGSTPKAGFSLIAEDGNLVPDVALAIATSKPLSARVQNEAFMAAGKTFDVMINVPAAGATALPIFDREGSLSGNAVSRDAGMLAYISVNGAGLPNVPAFSAVTAAIPDFYKVIPGQTLTVSDPAKGVIGNDSYVYNVILKTAPTKGTLTLNPDGTFQYVPSGGWSDPDSFVYQANGTGPTATVTLNECTAANSCLEDGASIALGNDAYTAKTATYIKINGPGVLANDKDPAGYPLQVDLTSVSASGGLTVTPSKDGGFIATLTSNPGGTTTTFTYKARNSQGTVSTSSATVTLTFPAPSNMAVKVVDGLQYKTNPSTAGQISDYRWIIQEDKTFYVDPKCTTNPPAAGCWPGMPAKLLPALNTNFNTSYIPVVAQGCTGSISCEADQTIMGSPAVCDIGNGVCRPAAGGKTQLKPDQVVLDPNKRYYISILPGDGMSTDANDNPIGHAMGGSQISWNGSHWVSPFSPDQSGVTVIVEPMPLPTSKVSVFVFEDDTPLNGEQDSGGGVDVLAPNEPGLGGFNITLEDQIAQNGDSAGQLTYDMFNMPLSNALAGTIDPATGLDACPVVANSKTGFDGTSLDTGAMTGVVPVCPRYESDGSTLSPLAGQAVIANLPPGRYGVVATPAADRIAAGEEWLQTNTLDGGKAHDSFLKAGEPAYFQEYGPAGFHVTIGFANPAIINARHTAVCAGAGGCGKTVSGRVTGVHMSRTPDERLYSSESGDMFGYTQCYVSLGSPDGADFAFTKCNGDGTFSLDAPAGDWRVTVFDQWNDMIVDGITTPVRVDQSTVDMGDIAVHSWKTNLYTRTFFDANGNGVSEDGEPGLSLVATNVRYKDGSFSNFNSTDLDGFAGFNEVFPLFNWYVVETDSTRYKNTGTHVVYDAGGPVDGASICGTAGYPPCGTSVIAKNLARTKEDAVLPTELRIPGARYCAGADCPTGDMSGGSTGRVDPPSVVSEGWQGFIDSNQFMEFGKKPFAVGENGGIRGHVIYASTRPFDDPALLLQLSWEPAVPNVTVNLYQVGTAPDGSRSLKLVDTTKTTSWDEWAQGFRKDANGNLVMATDGNPIPNMNCPGQQASDLFFFTLNGQQQWLNPGTPLPYNSQFKCFDGMHNWNQIQPAPYDGMYKFPSVVAKGEPNNQLPTLPYSLEFEPTIYKTNCTVCQPNPVDGTPMLPAGKYVVEMMVPEGYELVKEEDKNILMGDAYEGPVTQQFAGAGNIFIMPDQASVYAAYNPNNTLIPNTNLGAQPRHEGDTGSIEAFWPCVGETRIVPDWMSLFPAAGQNAPFAGASRPLCDKKEVTLEDQMSVLAKFYVFTPAHVASQFTGLITDDFTAEFDPFSPQYGEKFAPPYMPVAIKDWAGNDIGRVYADQWGAYNGLNFTSWGVNPPDPSGYVPQMMVLCMNDAGQNDPLFQPAYSQFCYELPFMPGEAAYFDTPVVPNSAFAGAGYNNPDCAYPDATPAVKEVDGDGIGPWVASTSSGAVTTVTVSNGGSGYTSAPAVIFNNTGTGGTGAAATAIISSSVSAVTVTNHGSGYSSAPAVTFSAPINGGATAKGTAVLTGGVTAISVGNGGSGYTSAPSVNFNNTGTGGSGAAASSRLKVGAVPSFTPGTGTTGYNNFPTGFNFPITGGGCSLLGGTCAVVHVTVGTTVPRRITAVSLVSGGSYSSRPGNSSGVVTVSIPFITGCSGTGCGTITLNMSVGAVNISNSGTNYASAPGVSFTGGSGSGATATATVTNTVVASVTIDQPGSGYTSAPTITIAPPASGVQATATAAISGQVVAVNVTNHGSTYSSAPTVSFTGGGGSGATATANVRTGTARLTILALGDQSVTNYQYSGPSATLAPYNQKRTTRHYGFGNAQGTVVLVDSTGGKHPLTNVNWSDTQISGDVPSMPNCSIAQQAQYGGLAAQCGELVITTAAGKTSIDTVTVTIGGKVPHVLTGGETIQSAIDAAAPGDLIIVPAGKYHELVQMWKPVRLQGVGAASSVIDANTHPSGILDAWRSRVNCLFGLTPDGRPRTDGDPSCGGSWAYFSSQDPQVDRLPLEGILGWDTTTNGNLAEQLQEPTLLGAYEGAGITVLGKGVRLSTTNPWSAGAFGAAAESAFPADAVLLTGAGNGTNCNNGGTNRYPSNFYCNPSRIDGLSVTNSSQGGGGILVHGWAHNLEVTNNRVYNNTGSMSGGISIGMGETPDAYLADPAGIPAPGSCGNSGTTGVELPFCFDQNVSIKYNAVTTNSSMGDELFSSTPAGAGGVTLCPGSDGYKLTFNWVCGNLSTGDGAGVAHLGYSENGLIDHNTILFNQSTNPTVPTSGGGLIIMTTAPDGFDPQGLECGTTTDVDCAPGLGDGTGPGLVINANLIMGNSADSGSGGGIRFQGVNGTEVSRFPTSPTRWYSASVTNNIIANNVAGWDGAGISLVDSFAVNIINNTIVSNDSTASSGALSNTFRSGLASSDPAAQCTSASSQFCAPNSPPQPAGVSAAPNSANMIASFQGLNITCPTGHPNCRSVSFPELYNDIIWQNRAFNITVGSLSPTYQQNIVQLVPTLNQAFTGECVSASSNNYWDIGVRGDAGALNHGSGVTLTPISSVLSSGDYLTSNHNSGSDPVLVSQYCNGSRVPPEFGGMGYNVPPGTNEGNVPTPVFNLTANATTDEGNNWINISWGPLTMTRASDSNILGNYALGSGSTAINYITSLNSLATYNAAPNTDFFGNGRKGNLGSDTSVDVGAVEGAMTSGGNGTASVAPTAVNFGTFVVGGAALPSQTLTLTNNSGVIVNGIAVAIATTSPVGSPNVFSRTGGTCSGTLANGANCTIVVTFTAPASVTTATNYAGNVTLTDSSSVTIVGSPVNLAASVSPAASSARVSPPSLTFGNQLVGTLSSTRDITVTNNGNQALAGGSFTGIAAPFARVTTGTFPSGAPNCGTTLAVGASCTVRVRFAPTAAGPFSGSVAISYTGATVSPASVSLSGTGTSITVAFAGPTPSLQNGSSSAHNGTVTVTNNSGAAVQLTSSASVTKVSGPGGNNTFSIVNNGTTCTNGANLQSGGTCNIVVRYTPPLGSTSLATGHVNINVTRPDSSGGSQTKSSSNFSAN